jgi:hypothetical protein
MQIAVVSTMIATARTITAAFDSAADSQPTRRYEYRAPTSASDPITRIPVVQIAQPPSQPAAGPSARVTQLNVVPASWSALFR